VTIKTPKTEHAGSQDMETKLAEMQRKFEAEQAKGGPISDKEFMELYEASDEEYARGMTLPAIGQE
jgi:hypothetical protein